MKPLAQYQELAVNKFLDMLPAGSKSILEIGSDLDYAVVDNISVRFSGTVTGINPSPGFVKRSPEQGPANVTILEADGCDQPFENKSFDAILSVATMEHVLDPPRFLAECYRILKPGGIFYTNFSPIWSSGIGHHVCAFAGRKEARFWKPDRNPLPDFSHLLWDEEEMRSYLLDSPYDDRLIEPIIDWVYRSDNINRCYYEDYLDAFKEARLQVAHFNPGIYKTPQDDILAALKAKHGRHREFSHHSIETVMMRQSADLRTVSAPANRNSNQPACATISDHNMPGSSSGTAADGAQNGSRPNVVINFHQKDQESAALLLNLLMAVDEGVACRYYLQYGDGIDTLTIQQDLESFLAAKDAVFDLDLPRITIPGHFLENDPNLASYPGNHAHRNRAQKHSILQWNLSIFKYINLLDSFMLLEPDCVILKEGWLAEIYTEYNKCDYPIFGHLKSGKINNAQMPTHWAGCSVYNGKMLRELELERFFTERYENPWWEFRNLPDTDNANNCFYGPAFSGYDVSYDYFLFAHFWKNATASSNPYEWTVQHLENRSDLIFCDFHSTLTVAEITDKFLGKLAVLHGVKNDDIRRHMIDYFTQGGSAKMKRDTAQEIDSHAGEGHRAAAVTAGTAQIVRQGTNMPPASLRPRTQEELIVMSNRRLGQYKGKHAGQRCVIIGNGPSLNKMDLSFLENEITFGMNRIYLMFDKWKFRPTYYVAVNPLVIEQSAEEILNITAPKFLSHKGIPFFDDPMDINFLQSIPQWFFSKDPRNGICEGWTVTYVAMQLAYFMGFTEVVLIGVDHHFVTPGDPNKEVVSEGDDPNHFHPGYFGKGIRWHLPDLEHSEGSYRMARTAFEAENRRILDATVDGKLTIFPKVDYRAIFCTNGAAPEINQSLAATDAKPDHRSVGASRAPHTNGPSLEQPSLRISAITPSYNQGKYVEQTILSVLNQQYANSEHIVIDGGSTDETTEILKKYPQLRWISESDRGQSDALNKGFQMATGDIIAWINSDDWYEPGVFSSIAEFFAQNPDKNVVMGDCNLIDENGKVFDTVVNNERGFEELKKHWIPRSIPTQPAIFFRRNLLDEFGHLDESLNFAMDYDLWMRFATKNRFYHLDRTVANYRFHSDAKGGDQDWTKFIPEWRTVYKRYCPPAVSVVIPCYNYAHYLSVAVSSVIGQTFQDFEIIIVNDGSTDATQEVAEKLIASLPGYEVKLINTQNSGNPAFPRNVGVKASRGSNVLFLDADDMLKATFLEESVKILDENPSISIVYTDQTYFDEKSSWVVATSDYDFDKLLNANFMAYCSLFRRKVWDDVGGVPTDVGYEDWDFWILSGLNGHHAQRIPKPLFCYRQHDTGRFRNDLILRDQYLKAQIVLKHRNVYLNETVCLAEKTMALTKNGSHQFNVMALISAHNEGDVIHHVIGDLVSQGIEVYLINHCSTDNTVEEASRWLGKGLVHIENFPQDAGYPEANNEQYIWHHILRRKEELAAQLDADWFIHSDADEFRESPWPGLTLKEAIQVADRMGYNALDFELLNFRPVDNGFVPGTDVREALRNYEGCEDFNAHQIKAWKNLKLPVSIFQNGGHNISFEGRTVCPVKFLLRHYPIRSQAHGEQKVFNERKKRFNAEERQAGWHVQYDTIKDERHNFLHNPADLTPYDADQVRLRILSAQALGIAAALSGTKTATDAVITAGTTGDSRDPVQATQVKLAGADIPRLIETANALANEGNVAKAAELYRQALAAEPANCPALVGIGVVKIVEGNHTEAAIAFSKALKSSPGDAKALCGLGLARSGQGRRSEGFDLFKKALDTDPDNLTALHELLKAAYELDRLSEAEAYLSGYLMYHPADSHILFSLAGLRYRLGAHAAALDVLERLLALEPGYGGGAELAERLVMAMGEVAGEVLLAAGA